MTTINEWMCPAHKGFPKTKADRYWMAHGGQRPFPASPLEWLERQGELAETVEITVKPRDKYWDVAGHAVGQHRAANDNAPVADNDNRPKWNEEWDDEIPF